LIPDAVVDRVEDVSAELLGRWAIRGIALDLDNTIVPWHTADLRASLQLWVAEMRGAGMALCILTNNYGRQAHAVAKLLEIPIVKGAVKPFPRSFRRALRALGTAPRQSMVIGDQLFTDVLGGKLVGMRAVLVRPIGSREFPTTKILRMLEAPIVRRLRRHSPPR